MGDKNSQISGLYFVHMNAVKEHKYLKEEEKRIRRLFTLMNQQRQHYGGNLHQYEGDHNPNYGSLYYNSQSVAESTLQQYGGGGQCDSNAGGVLTTRAG